MGMNITETENGFTVEFSEKPDDYLIKLHGFFDMVEKYVQKKDLPVSIKRINPPIKITPDQLRSLAATMDLLNEWDKLDTES